MIKFDENKNITKEYKSWVSNLDRKELEKMYIGADILIERVKKHIFENYKEVPCYDTYYKEIIDILEGKQ